MSFIPVPHFISSVSHASLPLQTTVHVPEGHVILRSLHAFVPLQSTVQVPELSTFKFSQAFAPLQSTVQVPELSTCNAKFMQPSPTAQRTTNSAVAATVITDSFDPSLSSISIRQFAFATHVTELPLEFCFTTFAQQLAMLPGDCGQVSNTENPLFPIHVAAEE